MANQLSKTGIQNSQTIQAWHVTQSIDALTAAEAYDITISGSLTLTGSVSSLNGFTGDLVGTASWASEAVSAVTATTASYALTATSSSYAATASSADTFIVRTALTASGLNYPTVDGTENEVIKTDGAGNLSLGHITTIYETVYAGENLTKTDPVYLSGSNGANPIAYKADAGNAAKSPAVYVMNQTLTAGQTGDAIALGLIEGINLTGYDAGTEVYVGVGGGWTATRPTGSATVQSLGIVTKGGSGGKGFVFNAGEALLPNLTSGYAWVGDSDGVPASVTTASFIGSGSYGASYPSGSVTIPSVPFKFLAGASQTDALNVATVTVNELATKQLNQTCFVTATAESSTGGDIITVDPVGIPPTLQFKSNNPNTKFHFQIMYI